jgi:hypothetical protein
LIAGAFQGSFTIDFTTERASILSNSIFLQATVSKKKKRCRTNRKRKKATTDRL